MTVETDGPESEIDIPDIEELLTRIAPPACPDQALSYAPEIVNIVAQWDPTKTVDILAGMTTDARFQAHQIRLDFAVRIVLEVAQGNRRPKSREIADLLNNQLTVARVSRLEDPIEDLFVEGLPTHEGEFLIFSGAWEKASVHTELLREAFRNLPDGEPKARALNAADALLRLSTALVHRSGLSRGVIGQGSPGEDMLLPSDGRLASLSTRVRFSKSDLADIGITEEDVAPFLLRSGDRFAIGASEPGDSPLEFRPLLKTQHGLIVAAPANLSTAVRAIFINAAHEYHLERTLQFNLLKAKAGLLDQYNFRPVPSGEVRTGDDHIYCETLIELSAGRFLHVILSVDGFRGWPQRAFGSVLPCSQEWIETLVGTMREAKARASANPGFVEGMTLWMPAGWGGGRSFAFTPDEELNDWMFLAAEPADIATISCCEDGKLTDIWRLQKQLNLVEEQGFEFFGMNGFLNLFHWWRTTDHALIPPNQIDATPPLTINFGTNLLLEARREAFGATDRRALQDEHGRWHVVARLERSERYKALDHAYASLDDVRHGRLAGVVVETSSQWWIKLDKSEHDRDIFETWKTILIWAGQVMPPFLKSVKSKHVVRAICFRITIDAPPKDGYFDIERSLSDSEIADGLELRINRETQTAHLSLKSGWFAGFYRPDNYAERALALKLLVGACQLFGIDRPIEELSALVLASAGSTDFRHRHAFQTKHAIDHLVANGLVKPFAQIPVSAGALAKCGSVWGVHPRVDGIRIEGKSQCLSLIRAFVESCQTALLVDIGHYDRTQFVVMALEGLQSALAEEGHWRRSARALRAIHGVNKDFELSLERIIAANGVIRACSMLAEMAAAEAAPEGGRVLGRMDLEEFQARALQLFQTADNYPAFLVDRIEPVIHLSPTGDILYQHDFHEVAIESTAKVRHARERSDSSDAYLTRFQEERTARNQDVKLEQSILAEYGVRIEVLREFAAATATLARQKNTGVMLLRRSELLTGLREIEFLSEFDFSPLVDRLMLPSRKSWVDIPNDCTTRDFDLSKFDRRFSLIARPLVALSSDDDPVLAVAPAVIERSLTHNISGAVQGTLQNEFWKSSEMRSYAGASGARIGIEFNQTLAQKLSSIGLKASDSVKPWACLNLKKTSDIEALGDVDVLVVSKDRGSVWICEAKDLKLCRTLGEAAQRLSEYRGQIKNGKPDKLLRHLHRVNYFRTNASMLGKRLGLSKTPAVHGVIIVNAPQPMQQLTGEYSNDSRVVMLDDIESVPWDAGWQ